MPVIKFCNADLLAGSIVTSGCTYAINVRENGLVLPHYSGFSCHHLISFFYLFIFHLWSKNFRYCQLACAFLANYYILFQIHAMPVTHYLSVMWQRHEFCIRDNLTCDTLQLHGVAIISNCGWNGMCLSNSKYEPAAVKWNGDILVILKQAACWMWEGHLIEVSVFF